MEIKYHAMRQDLRKPLLGILTGMFTGALIGYLWGWIGGWSIVDPNRDIWALAAGVLAVAGVLLGMLAWMRKYAVLFLCATFGLYVGWIARTLLFGDTPGGPGILLMLVAAFLGAAVALRLEGKNSPAVTFILLVALYAGFFGGFLLDVMVLDRILHAGFVHSIPGQAPAILLCGVLGGWFAALWKKNSAPASG
jgi:hypothetical protein